MSFEVIDVVERDDWPDDHYEYHGIAASVHHHEENDGDGNRHAIELGDDVIIVES